MKSLARIRKRLGRCYELAFKVIFQEADAERFTLVHGRVRPGFVHEHQVSGERIGHAWIETAIDKVFDPVSGEHTSFDQYQRLTRATVDRRYSRAEALRLVACTGHYGPWLEDEIRQSLK